jgi:DME family drug/metabolite transporter
MAVGGILLFSVAARASVVALRDPAALRWLLIGSLGVVVYPLAFYSAWTRQASPSATWSHSVRPTFVAYLLVGQGLTHLRSSVVTSVTLIEPLVATVLAMLVVGERLHPVGWFDFSSFSSE